MDDSAYEDEAVEIASARWHWTFLAVRVLSLFANITNAFRAFFGEVATDIGSHANYQMERDEFAADAGLELETILEGSEEE